MTEIVMPQLGESVTEGTITRWFKSVGDRVSEDEPLFEVSTDKVDTEVPAPASGVLTEIRVAEGETVEVGTVLAVVGDAGAAAAAGRPAGEAAGEAAAAAESAPDATTAPVTAAAPETAPTAPAPAPAPAPSAPPAGVPPAPAVPATPAPEPAPSPVPAPAPTPPAPAGPATAAAGSAAAGSAKLLSPMVRRLIEEHGLDPSTITGTGVGGRITREDVLDAIDARAVASQAPAASPPPASAPPSASVPPSAAPPPPAAAPAVAPMRTGAGDTVEELNKIRRMTGDHMVASKATSPHAVTIVEVDYEAVERVRRAERDRFRAEEGFSLTYLPFIARAVIDALREYPHMNASMAEGAIVVHHEVHLSIAVDLDFQGLLAPVVRDAHDKRLRAIARDIRDLADRARSKRLVPDELVGGTFTLSNSGSYGTNIVIAIINQPQVAILSTDGVRRKPVVVTDEWGNESIAIHSVGNLTLSWDHRAFDGAYAAAFLARVREILETRDWAAEL